MESYHAFRDHLEARYPCVREMGGYVIYDLAVGIAKWSGRSCDRERRD